MEANDILDGARKLREEVAALPVDEVLALAYAFRKRAYRLKLYAGVLRSRSGARAQFASSLICYDLARQGNKAFQREFLLLRGTMRHLAQDRGLVEQLLGEDPYLSFLWELCNTALQEEDATQDAALDMLWDHQAPAHEISLFDEQELTQLGLDAHTEQPNDHKELALQFHTCVDEFLGLMDGVPAYKPNAGFRCKRASDMARLEKFISKLESFADIVPQARGYKALATLFLGAHLRSRSVFGSPNRRKAQLLRQAIEDFIKDGPQAIRVAGVFNDLHTQLGAWDSMIDHLLHFIRWLQKQTDGTEHAQVDSDKLLNELEHYNPLQK